MFEKIREKQWLAIFAFVWKLETPKLCLRCKKDVRTECNIKTSELPGSFLFLDFWCEDELGIYCSSRGNQYTCVLAGDTKYNSWHNFKLAEIKERETSTSQINEYSDGDLFRVNFDNQIEEHENKDMKDRKNL